MTPTLKKKMCIERIVLNTSLYLKYLSIFLSVYLSVCLSNYLYSKEKHVSTLISFEKPLDTLCVEPCSLIKLLCNNKQSPGELKYRTHLKSMNVK